MTDIITTAVTEVEVIKKKDHVILIMLMWKEKNCSLSSVKLMAHTCAHSNQFLEHYS